MRVHESCRDGSIHTRTTKVGSPETNAMAKRLHCTREDESFSLAYRTRIYDSVVVLLVHLDGFLAFDNGARAHGGCRTQGRTPLRTFWDHVVLLLMVGAPITA